MSSEGRPSGILMGGFSAPPVDRLPQTQFTRVQPATRLQYCAPVHERDGMPMIIIGKENIRSPCRVRWGRRPLSMLGCVCALVSVSLSAMTPIVLEDNFLSHLPVPVLKTFACISFCLFPQRGHVTAVPPGRTLPWVFQNPPVDSDCVWCRVLPLSQVLKCGFSFIPLCVSLTETCRDVPLRFQTVPRMAVRFLQSACFLSFFTF